jgi:hypothetical protein
VETTVEAGVAAVAGMEAIAGVAAVAGIEVIPVETTVEAGVAGVAAVADVAAVAGEAVDPVETTLELLIVLDLVSEELDPIFVLDFDAVDPFNELNLEMVELEPIGMTGLVVEAVDPVGVLDPETMELAPVCVLNLEEEDLCLAVLDIEENGIELLDGFELEAVDPVWLALFELDAMALGLLVGIEFETDELVCLVVLEAIELDLCLLLDLVICELDSAFELIVFMDEVEFCKLVVVGIIEIVVEPDEIELDLVLGLLLDDTVREAVLDFDVDSAMLVDFFAVVTVVNLFLPLLVVLGVIRLNVDLVLYVVIGVVVSSLLLPLLVEVVVFALLLLLVVGFVLGVLLAAFVLCSFVWRECFLWYVVKVLFGVEVIIVLGFLVVGVVLFLVRQHLKYQEFIWLGYITFNYLTSFPCEHSPSIIVLCSHSCANMH